MLRAFVVLVLWMAVCQSQELEPAPLTTFGTTVVIPSGLRGEIFFVKSGISKLPDFDKLRKKQKPTGIIYTNALNIPPRNFREGFPGVSKRSTDFAIDYTGKFWIDKPGRYDFILFSDDGSKLYIDDRLIVDNDGLHITKGVGKNLHLAGGLHTIRVSYFQGPCGGYAPCLSLMLGIRPEGGKLRVFNTDELKPPPNPEDWKFKPPPEPEEKPR